MKYEDCHPKFTELELVGI